MAESPHPLDLDRLEALVAKAKPPEGGVYTDDRNRWARDDARDAAARALPALIAQARAAERLVEAVEVFANAFEDASEKSLDPIAALRRMRGALAISDFDRARTALAAFRAARAEEGA